MQATLSLPGGMQVRPLAESDNLFELTEMLHRAFRKLGDMGLNCTCVNQSVATTYLRAARGSCFVVAYRGRLIATITLYEPDAASQAQWYRRGDVASIHQFAVDPDFQGCGVGEALLALAEQWSLARGYRHVALDTAQPANHLLAFYQRRGYALIETMCIPGRNYMSVILSKRLASHVNVCGRYIGARLAYYSTPVANEPSICALRPGANVGSRANTDAAEVGR